MKKPIRPLKRSVLLMLIAVYLLSCPAKAQQSLIQVNGWNAYVHLPADYSTTTKSFPTIIFFPGSGEVGTNASLVIANGPGAYITQGWNGNIPIGTDTVEFIVISLQPPALYPVEITINSEIQGLKSLYRIDNKRLYLTGLSEGGWCCTTFVTGDPLGGPYTYASQVAGIVNVEGVKPDDNSPYPQLFQNFANAGGRMANFEQVQDGRDMPTYTNEMNSTVANSAILTETDFGSGGHCCWASFYGGQGTVPGNFTLDGISQNIYQWMARLALGQSTTVIHPTANAGSDQTIVSPNSSVTLSGSGTDANPAGSIVSYQWAQVSGPNTSTIANAASASTSVTGLIQGTYKFSLTAMDNFGATGTDTMQVTVSATNVPPTANAGTNQSITLPTNSLTLNGSGADVDGTVVSYLWKQITGPSTATISNTSTAVTTISNLIQGQYSFSLTATDNDGLTGADTVVITVNAAPQCNANAPVVYTISGTPDIYLLTPNPLWKGGDTIKIAAGNYTDVIEFDHLHGDPCRPITIINSGGLVSTTTIRFKSDCEYVHVTGTGDPKTPYGFKTLDGPIAVDYGHHLEFDHIEITNPDNGVGMDMKCNPDTTNPMTVFINGANNYSIDKFHIHNNYIHNTLGEGMYIGHSAPDGGDGQTAQYANGTYVLPLRMDSVEIDHNILDSTGWDGIQLSNARDGCSIHDNVINHAGVYNIGDQQCGIILGGNTTGSIYNNHIQDVTGNGIEVFGYGAINIYNNYVDSAGHDGTTAGQETLFANDIPTVSQPGPKQQVIVYSNIFNDPMPKAAIRVGAYYNNSLPSNIHDNKFCIPGATASWQSTYIALNPAGSSNVNNILYCGPVTPTPIANAGIDTVINLPVNSVTLRGSGTETNGSIISYKWTKASGPAAGTITSNTSASTTITGLAAGIYKFLLTVTDSSGITAADTVQVTVNIAPKANAGSNAMIILPVNSVTLNGAGTDSIGIITSYQWAKISGPSSGAITSATSASTTVTGLVQGIYNFALTVTDSYGATGKDTVQITVNAPPAVSAGSDLIINLPAGGSLLSVQTATATLDGSATDADGTIVSYQWAQVSGPAAATITSPTTSVTTLTGLVQGVYKFSLTAKDNNGAIGRDTVQVTVNTPPAANAGIDQAITLPVNNVSLSGSGTDADGTVVSYQWVKVTGPSSGTITSATSASTNVTGLVQGIYKFSLTVTDNDGAIGSDTMQVTVNAAPAAPVVSSGGTATGTTGTTFNYTITASNNSTSYGATGLPTGLGINTSTGLISGTPTVPGTYTITISATNTGGTGTKTLVITISNPIPSAPVISSGGTASSTVGATFNYTIVASNNPTSYSATGLPTGLSINASTGVISGTPTASGISNVTINAINTGGTGSNTLTITINPPAPVISSAATASGTTGTSFSYTVTASGTPTSYAATGLPAGLSVNTSTGLISGTPATSGTSAVTISATNAGGTGTKALTITINPPAPVISSAATASGITGTSFSYTVTASGTPTSYAATGLPAGLSVNTSTGLISGTPATSGTSAVTISATNAGGTGTKTLIITINPPAPVISSAATAAGTTGILFSYTITASNTPNSYTATGLPAGLNINTSTGVISGTPATSGSSTVAISATNAGGTGTKTLVITISNPIPAAPVISNGGTVSSIVGATFSYTILASNSPASYSATGLPAGLSINTGTGIISGTPTASGTSNVTIDATNAGGTGTNTLTITINPPVPVISSAATATGTTGSSFSYTITASNTPNSYTATGLPTGLSINASTGLISGTPATSGSSTVTISATNAGGAGTKTLTITINPAAPVISSAATATGTTGTAFSYAITASNTPSSYAATGLPTGLSINTSTGVIGGTPATSGSSTVTISATNAGGAGTKTLTITINPAAPVISSAATASGTTGTAFSYAITASNTPNSYTATGLPTGLSVNTSTGVISGTPATSGSSTVTISATNAGGTGTKALTITINPPAPVISSAETATGTAGTAFSFTITASNTPSSYAATGLPTGLSVNTSTGVISGTPTTNGTSTVSISATNTGGTGNVALVITISNPTPSMPVISSSGTASGTMGIMFNYAITASNNPTSYNATGLPAGLSINNSTGVISGMPAASSASNVMISVTNAGGTSSKELTITINSPTPVISSNGTANGTTGTTFSYTISASNTPASYGTTVLPAGLIVNTSTGIISGTPTVSGTFNVTINATNTGGAGTKALVITIGNPPSVNAGIGQSITLPINNIILTGNVTASSNRTITSYQWIKIAGPSSGIIVNPTLVTTTADSLNTTGIYKFELIATDNLGAIGKDTMQVTVNPATVNQTNVPPTANAGVDQLITLPVNIITLNGKGSDVDGTIASYKWVKVAGPTAGTITSATSASTTVTAMLSGIYKFVLTVTDNKGATGRDTVQVTVNTPPAANAGKNQIITLPINAVALSGKGSDADGTIASYQWTKISGPASATIANATSANTTINGLTEGVYGFTLTVTDNDGATAKDTMQVIVNTAPIANAGTDQTITLPVNSVTLSGSGVDVDGTIASYKWVKASGPTAGTITSSTSAGTTVKGLTAGVYKFLLTVTDNDGGVGTDSVLVTVNPAIVNNPPVVNAGSNITIKLPVNSVTLNGTATDVNGKIASYQWTEIAGAAADTISNAASETTTVTGLTAGTYKFVLTVTDTSGLNGRDTIQVIVQALNIPPVANAGSDITISLPTTTATLDGSGTDVDGTITAYHWAKIAGPSRGSIGNASNAQINLTNLEEGVYEYELTVTDNDGAKAKDTVQVTVTANLSMEVFAGPIPVQTALTAQVSNIASTSQNLAVTLTNVSGTTVYHTEIPTTQSTQSINIDMSNLRTGMYFLKISSEGAKQSVTKTIFKR